MSSTNRMRWRPAVGVLTLGVIAVGLAIQGASAERSRSVSHAKAEKKNVTAATPTGIAPAAMSKAVSSQSPMIGTQAPAAPASPKAKAAAEGFAPQDIEKLPEGWISPDDGFDPNLQKKLQAASVSGAAFDAIDRVDAIAGPGLGACCTAGPCGCANVNLADCNLAGGTWFAGASCANDFCGCTVAACCSTAGACANMTRAACQTSGGLFNVDATCAGSATTGTPICANATANCSWDNGAPLNAGNAVRAHRHTLGNGQLPRYAFLAADDFVLGHGVVDNTSCEISVVTAYHRQRPANPNPPNPPLDWEAAAVTIYSNYADPISDKATPGGYGIVPVNGNDTNNITEYVPGGVVYSRVFPVDDGDVAFAFQAGFCDPPGGNEAADVWEITVSIDPPILLNKKVRYWISIEGVFPFNDGLRLALQTWNMLSVNANLERSQTFRTDNANYIVGECVGGPTVGAPCYSDAQCGAGGTCPNINKPVWVQINRNAEGDAAPAPVQPGNLAGVAPCTVIAANVRFDLSWKLSGAKVGPIPNNECDSVSATATPIFDGYTEFNNSTATDSAQADPSCGTITNDQWYLYEGTCDGVLGVTVTGLANPATVVIYNGPGCSPPAAQVGCASGVNPSAGGIINITGLYQIRIGTSAGAGGKGVIEIRCTQACGAGADCCDPDIECLTNADCPVGSTCGGPNPPALAGVCDYVLIGCTNPDCCEAVCADDAFCCGVGVGAAWDDQCAAAAGNESVCPCASCTFSPVAGGNPVNEGENAVEGTACANTTQCQGAVCIGGLCDCKGNLNGGCNNLPNAETFQNINAGDKVSGLLWAEGGFRGTDWYRFSVTDADGEAEIVVTFNGALPVGVILLGTQTDDNPATSFCRDTKKCSVAETPCNVDGDCPSGETCEAAASTLIAYDVKSVGGCAERTLRTCVPSPGTYALEFFTVETVLDDDDQEVLGDGIFDGLGCDSDSLNYSFLLTVNDDCGTGACCTCVGGCTDGLTENACFDQGGIFGGRELNGEGTLCSAISADCAELAHGCSDAITIACNTTELIDLREDPVLPGVDLPFNEAYPCANAGADPDDQKWLKFVATNTSARVDTCTSAPGGSDSLLGIFEGTCCGGLGNALTIGACADDDCDLTEYNSNICVTGLSIGTTYYIAVSNWDATGQGQYNVRLSCPCSVSCCTSATATCVNGVAVETCLDDGESANSLLTCEALDPDCGFGACCTPTGTCTDTLAPNCPDPNNHYPNTSCAIIACQTSGTCVYDDELQGGAGFRSQFSPDNNRFLEFATNFELKGDLDNDCEVSKISWRTFHTNHDFPCKIGGLGSCNDNPSDYAGLIVTISNDVTGFDKGPTCVPDCNAQFCTPGADGDYHIGAGCKFGFAFGPAAGDPPPVSGNYWTYETFPLGGQNGYILTAHFDPPLILEKNKKNWFAVTHIWQQNSGYSVIWNMSENFDGNYNRAYDSAGDQEWVASILASDNRDLTLKVHGVKDIGCGPCHLFGDPVEPFCAIDVDDIVYLLNAFSDADPCTNYPGANIVPCPDDCGTGGTTDVDDIIAVLGAFAGDPVPDGCANACPPGGCVLPSTECRDQFYFPNGMSETDCALLGGSYCGDGTVCGVDCP